MLGRKMCREACLLETNRCLDSTVHPHAGGTAMEHRGGEIGLSQGKLLGKLIRPCRRGQTERQSREGSPDCSEQKARVGKTGQKLKISGIQVPP